MRADVEDLKTKVAGGLSAARRSSSRGSERHDEYNAQKLWINGYMAGSKAKERTSLSVPHVKELVNAVYNEMSDDLKQHVDVGSTDKFANRVLFTKFAICLKNVTDREVAWSVKAELGRIRGKTSV